MQPDELADPESDPKSGRANAERGMPSLGVARGLQAPSLLFVTENRRLEFKSPDGRSADRHVQVRTSRLLARAPARCGA